jgi:hypothetical protein
MVASVVVPEGADKGIPNFGQPPPLHPDDNRTFVFGHAQDWGKVLVCEDNQLAPPLPLPLVPFPWKEFVSRGAGQTDKVFNLKASGLDDGQRHVLVNDSAVGPIVSERLEVATVQF